jgi:hypothetical protein
MRRRRRRHRRNPSPGFWAWANKHWFLTFLLASSAIGIPVAIAQAMFARQRAAPPSPPSPTLPPAVSVP